jgi:hypothetical protein
MALRSELNPDPTTAASVTALVPYRQPPRNRLAQRQQAILEHLHRGVQTGEPPSPELNAVWAKLRGDWSWVVTVPAEQDSSTADLARALARTGARLSIYPVDYIQATDLDLDSSTRLIARLGISGGADEERSPMEGQPLASDSHAPPITKTIVALVSPLANPLALPIAMAADGIVLCVRRGRDRIASVRKTLLSVGVDRIRCCVLID